MYSTYSAAKTGQSPIQNNIATRIWFSETGLIAFATTLDWNGVKALYAGFSKATCQNLGKVKNVIPKKESMVQIPFHKYVSNSSHACKVIVHMHTHAQSFALHIHLRTIITMHIQGSVQDKTLHRQVVHVKLPIIFGYWCKLLAYGPCQHFLRLSYIGCLWSAEYIQVQTTFLFKMMYKQC